MLLTREVVLYYKTLRFVFYQSHKEHNTYIFLDGMDNDEMECYEEVDDNISDDNYEEQSMF